MRQRVVASWRDVNPAARHPDMEPTGAERPLLYVLGEAPGENEDQVGRQFIGDSGKRLRALIPKALLERTRWNNVVRTRPPENRTPTQSEVEYYRKSVADDIAQTRPRVVLAVGALAASWGLGSIGSITLLRGRSFPMAFKPAEVWFSPVHHPAWILRVENQKKVADVPGEEWRRVWERDIARAVELAQDSSQRSPHVHSSVEPHLLGGIRWYQNVQQDRAQIEKALRAFSGVPCAFDFETIKLRPYESGATIRTVAIANGMETVAFPWDITLRPAFEAWLTSPGAKVAHNLAFEQEWIAAVLGSKVLRRMDGEDTQAQAYVLDERKGGHNLDFLCRLHFGLELKELSLVNRQNVAGTTLLTLLRYNALDAKFTYKLWREQALLIRDAGLQSIYKDEHCRRIPTAVLAQQRGLATDPECTRRFSETLDKEAHRRVQAAVGLPDVAPYRKRHGKFNPSSPRDVLRLLQDLGFGDKLKVREDKYSTDDDVLSKINHPVAKAVLALRKVQKLKGTYVDRLDPKAPNSYVFPDGRLHPQFHTLTTDTGRFSCVAPWTRVVTWRGDVPISEVVVGDFVRTHRDRFRKVERVIYKGIDQMVDVCLSNGSVLSCTVAHRLLLADGSWKTVAEIISERRKKVDKRSFKHRCSSRTVPIHRDSYDLRDCCQTWNNKSQRHACSSFQLGRCNTQSAQGAAVLCVEDRQVESNERETRCLAPQLDRGMRSRVSDDTDRRTAQICSSCCDGSRAWTDQTSKGACGASHRRGSVKQPPRQPGDLYQGWAQIDSLLASRNGSTAIEAIIPRGCVPVYDLTVAEDHSYESCGVFHHNSSDPNGQNFPKRKHAEIRSQVIADPGCVLMSCDYGQLEARVIASLSGEFKIVREDIHLAWAERIAKLHPPAYTSRGSDIKVLRNDIKSMLVFPLFYGTTAAHVGAMLDLPRGMADDVYDEFWEGFPKVRAWQEKLIESYHETGYVESPTGRRRRAPLNRNQIINTPVQGGASDIVVGAMNRLSERAFTEGPSRLQPVLNIHDDLTLCVPKKHLDTYVDVVSEEMLRVEYSWVRVPMQVEIGAGPNWYEQKHIGKFSNEEAA